MAHTADRWLLSAAALWLNWLLLVHAGLCPDTSVLSRLPTQCQKLTKVCLDQNVYVLYENEANPRHELFSSMAKLQLRNITVDYYGFSDVWGTHLSTLNRCIPMVVYSSHLYMYGNFFANTVTAIHMMQQAGVLDTRLSLVLDTFGMKMEPFHSFLLAPFTPFDVTTLSHMSSRQPREQPESYSPDGQHARCFWHLLACQFGGTDPQPPAPVDSPLWSTGQAVLIGVLPRRSKLRAIVNQDQVWSWCLKFKPPQGVQDWNGTACLLHEFGKDLKADLVYSSQADVMIGVHGAGLFNAFFMPQHSSLIEIRPLNFTGHLPNQYMKASTWWLRMHHGDSVWELPVVPELAWQGQLASVKPNWCAQQRQVPSHARGCREADMAHHDGDSIFWWGVNVVNPAHSAPGVLELQRRGAPHTWSRERHTFVRLMALQYLLERITLTRTDKARYASFREKHEHYISDALDKLNDTQRHRLLHHSPCNLPTCGQDVCVDAHALVRWHHAWYDAKQKAEAAFPASMDQLAVSASQLGKVRRQLHCSTPHMNRRREGGTTPGTTWYNEFNLIVLPARLGTKNGPPPSQSKCPIRSVKSHNIKLK
ncbi:hypothetical protein COO60DRAFT_1457009 [Scenedesmus sp. NREL 46B-D3]|nr:hypothetical protein COO60DRAFT_1457009 [Scenedesmus sp. NREL 46B-D3]